MVSESQAMAYVGEVMLAGGTIPLDLSWVDIVEVTGDGPNVCGHVLLHIHSGYYFHVPGLPAWRDFPRYMSAPGYRRYLRSHRKSEVRRRSMALPRPGDAAAYLERAMARRWNWLLIPNNCVTFVEEIIAAGGGTWSSVTNCPTISMDPTLSERWEGLERQYDQFQRGLIRDALERQIFGF